MKAYNPSYIPVMSSQGEGTAPAPPPEPRSCVPLAVYMAEVPPTTRVLPGYAVVYCPALAVPPGCAPWEV
jgi:hypothetical protein